METSTQDSRTLCKFVYVLKHLNKIKFHFFKNLADQERVGLREIFQRFECSVCKAPSGGFVRSRICNKCKVSL